MLLRLKRHVNAYSFSLNPASFPWQRIDGVHTLTFFLARPGSRCAGVYCLVAIKVAPRPLGSAVMTTVMDLPLAETVILYVLITVPSCLSVFSIVWSLIFLSE